MATAAEQTFAKKVQSIEAKWGADQKAALRRVGQLLDQYEADVVAAIASGPKTEWQAHNLKTVQQGIQQARSRLEARLNDEWEAGSGAALTAALGGVDDALSAIGVPATTPFAINQREAFLVSEYTPSLIKDLTTEQYSAVQKAMQGAVLGATAGPQMVAAVRKAVGGKRRAQVVFRTEMNRLHNLTRTRRIDELSVSHPALGKKWLHRHSLTPRPAHTALDGKVIHPSDNELFNVNGVQVPGPHDPALPAEDTINCHCTVVATYDESRVGKGQQAPEKSLEDQATDWANVEAVGGPPMDYEDSAGGLIPPPAAIHKMAETGDDPMQVYAGYHYESHAQGENLLKRMRRRYGDAYVQAGVDDKPMDQRPIVVKAGVWTAPQIIKLVNDHSRRAYSGAVGRTQAWMATDKGRSLSSGDKRFTDDLRSSLDQQANFQFNKAKASAGVEGAKDGDSDETKAKLKERAAAASVLAWYVAMGQAAWGAKWKARVSALDGEIKAARQLGPNPNWKPTYLSNKPSGGFDFTEITSAHETAKAKARTAAVSDKDRQAIYEKEYRYQINYMIAAVDSKGIPGGYFPAWVNIPANVKDNEALNAFRTRAGKLSRRAKYLQQAGVTDTLPAINSELAQIRKMFEGTLKAVQPDEPPVDPAATMDPDMDQAALVALFKAECARLNSLLPPDQRRSPSERLSGYTKASPETLRTYITRVQSKIRLSGDAAGRWSSSTARRSRLSEAGEQRWQELMDGPPPPRQDTANQLADNETTKAWRRVGTPAQMRVVEANRTHIKYYQSNDGYSRINRALRSGRGRSAALDRHLDGLREACVAEAPEDMVIRRGNCSVATLLRETGVKKGQLGQLVGTSMRQSTFSSCGCGTSAFSTKEVELKILVRKGDKMVPFHFKGTSLPHERELLLPDGAELVVHRVVEDPDPPSAYQANRHNKVVIYCEYVPPGEVQK